MEERFSAPLEDLFSYLEENAFKNLSGKQLRPRLIEQEVEYEFKLKYEGDVGRKISVLEFRQEAAFKDEIEEEIMMRSKEAIEIQNRNQRILERLLQYGTTKEEIVHNIGKQVFKSLGILFLYRNFLEQKATIYDDLSIQHKLELEQIDSQYLNLYGLKN